MLHLNDGDPDIGSSPQYIHETTLKQVEFNSFSCSGGSHANKVANMHRYLTQKGVYNLDDSSFDVESLPTNENIESIALALALAHKTYGRARSKSAKLTAVLFVVQPYNVGYYQFWVDISFNKYSSLILQMSDRLSMPYGTEKSRYQPIGSIGVRKCFSIHG